MADQCTIESQVTGAAPIGIGPGYTNESRPLSMFRKICLAVFGFELLVAPIGITLALQPAPAMLRRLFEQELARRKQESSGLDARAAQAARDLGMLLSLQGDAASAQRTLAEALHIDEKVFGPMAPQTLADVAELAGVSPEGQAEALWRRA